MKTVSQKESIIFPNDSEDIAVKAEKGRVRHRGTREMCWDGYKG